MIKDPVELLNQVYTACNEASEIGDGKIVVLIGDNTLVDMPQNNITKIAYRFDAEKIGVEVNAYVVSKWPSWSKPHVYISPARSPSLTRRVELSNELTIIDDQFLRLEKVSRYVTGARLSGEYTGQRNVVFGLSMNRRFFIRESDERRI